MIETYRGVVNTWECDEMGHMNVRFYVAKAMDGVQVLGSSLGLLPSFLRHAGLTLTPHEQHLRFHREVHPGDAVVMRGSVVQASAQELAVYQELRRSQGDVLCATIHSRVGLCRAEDRVPHVFGEAIVHGASAQLTSIPEQGLPRGLILRTPRPALSLKGAEELGLHRVYRGIVRSEDADLAGFMRAESFMGRISDGVPHFFHALGGLTRDPAQGLGGAALEYRLIYRAFPRLGDVLEIRSGLRAQRGKTTEFCNFIFDVATGECVMSSDAIAVMFDMKLRKAVAPPPEVVERLMAQAVPDLTV